MQFDVDRGRARKTLTATYAGDTNFNGSADTEGAPGRQGEHDDDDHQRHAGSVGGGPELHGELSRDGRGAGQRDADGHGDGERRDGGTCTARWSATGTCKLTSTIGGREDADGDLRGRHATSTAASDTEAHQVDKARHDDDDHERQPGSVGGGPDRTRCSYGGVGRAGGGHADGDGDGERRDGDSCDRAAVGAGTCHLTSTTAGAKTLTATYAGDTQLQRRARHRGAPGEQGGHDDDDHERHPGSVGGGSAVHGATAR